MKRLIVGAGVLIVAGAFAVGLLVDDPPQGTSAVESPTPSPGTHGVSRADDGVVLYSSPPEISPSPPPLSVEVAEPDSGIDFDPNDGPPQATLASVAGVVEGKRGTSCWTFADGRRVVCADTFLPVPSTGIEADWGETLTLSFEHPEGPTSETNRWIRAPKDRSWLFDGDVGRTGPWVLLVSTGWDIGEYYKGNASYGFLVNVRPR